MSQAPIDFATILDDLLSQRENTENAKENSDSATLPKADDWWVLLNAPALKSPRGHRYPRAVRPPPAPKVPRKQRPEEPSIPLDRLDPEAIVATATIFRMAGQALPTTLRATELRKLYHQLAVRLHPDTTQRADSSQFRQLAKAYGIVRRALKSLPP